MRKILLIVNPNAGRLYSKINEKDIAGWLSAGGERPEVMCTGAAGDATRFVKQLGSEFDIVVCCGGDGTLNEVVSGVMTLDKKPVIGYIPAGTTNDFATSINLPKDVQLAAKRVLEGTPKKFDVGKFNDSRYFTYVASFGAFTESSYEAPRSLKKVLGHLAYLLEGIKDIGNIHPCHVTITVDGTVEEGDYLFGAISNSTSIGGVVKLDKSVVDFSDGLFEVMLIRNLKKPAELHKLIYALTSQNYNEQIITFKSASEIVLETEEIMPWSLDGEYEHGSRKVCIRNVREAVEIIV